MADPPFLILGEKEEMTVGRKAGWASKIELGPLLSSKSGSATGNLQRDLHIAIDLPASLSFPIPSLHSWREVICKITVLAQKTMQGHWSGHKPRLPDPDAWAELIKAHI